MYGTACVWPVAHAAVGAAPPVVRSRFPSSETFRIAVYEVRDRIRRGHRVVRYVSRKANPAHELAREGLKKLVRQGLPAAA